MVKKPLPLRKLETKIRRSLSVRTLASAQAKSEARFHQRDAEWIHLAIRQKSKEPKRKNFDFVLRCTRQEFGRAVLLAAGIVYKRKYSDVELVAARDSLIDWNRNSKSGLSMSKSAVYCGCLLFALDFIEEEYGSNDPCADEACSEHVRNLLQQNDVPIPPGEPYPSGRFVDFARRILNDKLDRLISSAELVRLGDCADEGDVEGSEADLELDAETIQRVKLEVQELVDRARPMNTSRS